ncbi:uncharacterized protein LOC118737488 [Rhagoletis pomonella]|uniref:uncharacterized protein LOC118737488 n=1 Tax=Rhagoletis pomonella TaxID=28610 RepID=UPI00177C7437|nr:uncharacterized protein LOC118737488 [Rhagoletis pomonella]
MAEIHEEYQNMNLSWMFYIPLEQPAAFSEPGTLNGICHPKGGLICENHLAPIIILHVKPPILDVVSKRSSLIKQFLILFRHMYALLEVALKIPQFGKSSTFLHTKNSWFQY